MGGSAGAWPAGAGSHLGCLNSSTILIAGSGGDDQLCGDASVLAIRHISRQVPLRPHREAGCTHLAGRATQHLFRRALNPTAANPQTALWHCTGICELFHAHLEHSKLLTVRGQPDGVRPVLDQGQHLVVDLCVSLQQGSTLEPHGLHCKELHICNRINGALTLRFKMATLCSSSHSSENGSFSRNIWPQFFIHVSNTCNKSIERPLSIFI